MPEGMRGQDEQLRTFMQCLMIPSPPPAFHSCTRCRFDLDIWSSHTCETCIELLKCIYACVHAYVSVDIQEYGVLQTEGPLLNILWSMFFHLKWFIVFLGHLMSPYFNSHAIMCHLNSPHNIGAQVIALNQSDLDRSVPSLCKPCRPFTGRTFCSTAFPQNCLDLPRYVGKDIQTVTHVHRALHPRSKSVSSKMYHGCSMN